MKKDHIRDYATEAFRYYAFMGKPHKEDLEKKYYQEALEEYERRRRLGGTGISKPTEQAVMYAEGILRQKQAELWDVLAVEKTLAQLHIWERQAVEIVYFERPHRELEKNDISMRVQKAVIHIPASERSVYYYLKKARDIFAFERGLRK
ncbi:hypothetical protein HZF24_06915 [Sedimentibacter hydroxybenzoicus DSM 7310]|uniref:Uncharacterized protein n=1 Tax=Sedimentibacter hydroxybenzoicus DSM 7310 TaxID=1123245 RepID=A0A974GVY0_SEDHY|nr:hypothetical protein [Sedimentibacter hydroxybenzoicus]NYB73869.1 hypothetical protein [Sedimentibacter hydroxybenzoicus DSM 7310]